MSDKFVVDSLEGHKFYGADGKELPAGELKRRAGTANTGMVQPGNIDLTNRPVVKNEDGSISTVRSMSFEENGKEILIPTVSPSGVILTDEGAIALYHHSGQHLGIFKDAASADTYAQQLHLEQEKMYVK